MNRNFISEFIHEWRKSKILFIMLIPAVLYFVVFQYMTMGGLLLAFKKFVYAKGVLGSPWVGFSNFEFLFKSGAIFRITRNTILYNLSFLIITMSLQIGIAIFLSELKNKVFSKIAQSMMFIPYFVSYVILGAFVYNLFNHEFGVLNTMLKYFNIAPIDVYNSPGLWKYILQGFHTWKWLGYGSVIYLAAIMGIDTEFYEAADIDGATMIQKIKDITIPLITPTIVITILFNIGFILKGQFELFYQLVGDNSMLFDATDVIDTYVFRSLARNFDIGMGSAVSFYQSVFGLTLVLVVNYVVKKTHKEYALF